MEKLNFSTTINATPERIWEVLWGDKTYGQWTSVFSEGSRAETDWKLGSKIYFLDGKGNGMVSQVAEIRPNEYMSIHHLGMVKDGIEDLTSAEVKKWEGAHENYSLTKSGTGTMLDVDMDSVEEFSDYFRKTWPTAMDKLKEISES